MLCCSFSVVNSVYRHLFLDSDVQDSRVADAATREDEIIVDYYPYKLHPWASLTDLKWLVFALFGKTVYKNCSIPRIKRVSNSIQFIDANPWQNKDTITKYTSRWATGSPRLAQMSLPWQQGSAPQHFAWCHWIGHPRKPPSMPKHLRSICHTNRLI